MISRTFAIRTVAVTLLALIAGCGGGGGPKSYTVTATAGSGGSVSPASATVTEGTTTLISITLNEGYEIAEVTGCGGTLTGTTYTTGPVSAACSINATFRLKKYTVTATAGTGGVISPTSLVVEHGSRATFAVTPAVFKEVATISGCGGALSSATFTTAPIQASCEVRVTFQPEYAKFSTRFVAVQAPSPDIAAAIEAVESRGPSSSSMNVYTAATISNTGRKMLVMNLQSYPDGCNFDFVVGCEIPVSEPYAMRSRLIALEAQQTGAFSNVTSRVFGTNDTSVGALVSIKARDINGDGFDDILAVGNQDHDPIPSRGNNLGAIEDQFGKNTVFLSNGTGGYRRTELGPRAFYESGDFVFLDPTTPIALFAGNNYEGFPYGSEVPTRAFRLAADQWTDISNSFVSPSPFAGCCGKYLASSQFIVIPKSRSNRTTQAIIDNAQKLSVDYRLWTLAGATLVHSSTTSLPADQTITIVELNGDRNVQPVIRVGDSNHLFGGWLASCVIHTETSANPVAVSGVSLWRINQTPLPSEIRRPSDGSSGPYGSIATLVNYLLGVSITNGRLEINPLVLPGKDDLEGERFVCEDLDGDSLTDIVLMSVNKATNIFIQRTDGTFRQVNPAQIPSISPPYNLSSLADYTGDGILDLVYFPVGVKRDPAASLPWKLGVYRGER